MTTKANSPWSLTGRWVIPIDGTPLPEGVVVVQGDRLVAIEPRGRRRADLDLGNVAILPGFVNVHTHLDLTGLHGKCPPTPDFTGWLRQVIAHRRNQSAEQVEADIRTGLTQSLANGVTLLGDISAGGLSWSVPANPTPRVVVYYELLGLTELRSQQTWIDALAWLQGHQPTPFRRPALSPHAPYSVRAGLFEQAAASPSLAPVAIHVAETQAELQLLRDHAGPFVDFLKNLGVWDPTGLVAGIEPLLTVFQNQRPLWIHGNYLDPANPMLRQATVVYCPRTHAAFGHPPHPFREMQRHGIPLALGTDSLASNPDLSILEEIRFLHRHYSDLDGAWLLYLATLAGAIALGWDAETGSLSPGKSADMVMIPLPDQEAADPHRLVLESTNPPARVLLRGQFCDEVSKQSFASSREQK